jgi:hypothetical protein
LDVLLLKCLLVESSLRLILSGVLPLALCADQSGGRARASLLLALLGAIGWRQSCWVAAVEASILRPTTSLVLTVVVEPYEPTSHKR